MFLVNGYTVISHTVISYTVIGYAVISHTVISYAVISYTEEKITKLIQDITSNAHIRINPEKLCFQKSSYSNVIKK